MTPKIAAATNRAARWRCPGVPGMLILWGTKTPFTARDHSDLQAKPGADAPHRDDDENSEVDRRIALPSRPQNVFISVGPGRRCLSRSSPRSA
jgi:hypothetical protein